MSDNVFNSCKTESEIMKRIFELSGSDKYTRVELLQMANERRAELKNENSSSLVFHKVVLPETPEQNMNELARQSVVILGDPKGSDVFEFMPDGRVSF